MSKIIELLYIGKLFMYKFNAHKLIRENILFVYLLLRLVLFLYYYLYLYYYKSLLRKSFIAIFIYFVAEFIIFCFQNLINFPRDATMHCNQIGSFRDIP